MSGATLITEEQEKRFTNKQQLVEFINLEIGKTPFKNKFNQNDLSLLFTHGKEDLVESVEAAYDLSAVRIKDFLIAMSKQGLLTEVFVSFKEDGQHYHIILRGPQIFFKEGVVGISFPSSKNKADRLREVGYDVRGVAGNYVINIHPLLVGGVSFKVG